MPTTHPRPIAALRAGEHVDAVFACPRKRDCLSRDRRPYVVAELSDDTGTIQARAYGDGLAHVGAFAAGDAIQVSGLVRRYDQRLEIQVSSLRRIGPAGPHARVPPPHHRPRRRRARRLPRAPRTRRGPRPPHHGPPPAFALPEARVLHDLNAADATANAMRLR